MMWSLFLLAAVEPPRIIPPPQPPPPIFWTELKAKEIQLEVNLKDPQGEVILRIFFHNPYPNATGEGVVLIPLPETAVIDRLMMEMDGVELSGELLDRAKAEQIYESIVRRRKDPAILTYFSPRVLQAKIFPIAPDQTRSLTIRYITMANVVRNMRDLSIPLTPALAEKPSALKIRVFLSAPVPLRNVYSPSHSVQVFHKDERSAEISYQETFGESMFRLMYTLSQEPMDAHFLSYRIAGDDGYFLLFLNPEIPREEHLQAKDIAFIIDISGSMAGTKLEQAKQALQNILDRLGREDRFNIFAFASTVEQFSPQWERGNDLNLEKAKRFVNRLDASGGTNISSALERAFLLPTHTNRPTYLLLLTDGNPTEGISDWNSLIAWARKQNESKFHIYAFGVGDDVNIPFLDKLAEENGGTAQYTSRITEVEVKVSQLYEQVRSPVLSRITIDWEGAEVFDVYPKKIIDFFAGKTISIAGRFGAGSHLGLSLKGWLGEKQKAFRFSFPLPRESEEYRFLPRVWAGRKIGHLINEIRMYGHSEEKVRSIIDLSKRYGILTEYTAFLVEEPRPIVRALRMAPAQGEAAMEEAQALKEYTEITREEKMETGTVLTVGDQTFARRDDRWVTLRYEQQPTKKIPLFSDEYFDLWKRHPELAPILALGKGCIFEFQGIFYELVSEEG